MKREFLTGIFVVLVHLLSLPVEAVNPTWNNATGDNMWNTAGNWAASPVNATDIFNSGSPAGTVFFNANFSAQRVRQSASAPARTVTIAATNQADATFTVTSTASENFDLSAATANLTFDGTPNGNGARLKMSLNTAGAITMAVGRSLVLNLDISGNGGVRNTGSGTVVLGGINSYKGNTSLNTAGTVSLSDNAALTFYIGANGVNNKITFDTTTGGTVNLDGDFNFDLSAANTTSGNSWNVVDVANLTETFGTTFTVLNGFSETDNVWTKADGDNLWSFSEATGVLQVSAVPEPSSAALAAIAGLSLWVRSRRSRSA